MSTYALRWAADAEESVRYEWAAGRVAQVAIGRRWEVVRIVTPLGERVVSLALNRGVRLGPVLETIPRMALEIVVPLGTAASWPALPATCCVCVGAGTIVCPAPTVTRRPVRGRRWIVPPDPRRPENTDGDVLCELVTEASASRALARYSPACLIGGR